MPFEKHPHSQRNEVRHFLVIANTFQSPVFYHMSTLYIHIGHGKTGSSWIQSSLRSSRESLASHSLHYANGPDALLTKMNLISSGNATGLLSSEAEFERRLSECTHAGGFSVIFSSEFLFTEIKEPGVLGFMLPVAKQFGYRNIEILIFIRDPLEYATSIWQQRVKGGGWTLEFEELLQVQQSIGEIDERVAKLLEDLHGNENIRMTVRNYNRCKDSLLQEVEQWLQVPASTLVVPPFKRVNRSMTRGEIRLQLEFNRILGKCGNLISNPLCEKLTDIEPDRMIPSLAFQKSFFKCIEPALARANALLKKEDQYRFELQKPTEETDNYVFNREQIRVIAENLGGEILVLRNDLLQKDLEALELRRQVEYLGSENQRAAEELKRLNEEAKAKSMEIRTLKMAMEKSMSDNQNIVIIHEIRHFAYRVKKRLRRTFHALRKNNTYIH